ncbi:PhoH family protein [Galactobacter valiniphilus]|uniref:PhoH-like protein n=1 Tax=Galactobacter valiniphilus TaxID=2676122 RepID=A0A399JC82_9MICC|nr:PhoH family protein [Galactobacter valiniphilus]RII43161.1 PhoH family protein [Galactobacter valiniphilus]
MTESSTSQPDTLDIAFPDAASMIATLGPQDTLLRILAGVWRNVRLQPLGESLRLVGPAAEVGSVSRVIAQARAAAASGSAITSQVVERLIRAEKQLAAPAPDPSLTVDVLRHRGRHIRPKTVNQAAYIDSMDTHTITFGVGPAGTGKTYLAMARAVAALQSKEISRIILTRPAVEAGESLGFLPGTLADKIDPYLRPLYDALHDMVEAETIPRLIAAGTIEVAPLAYMRGRTLNDAFVILDEAQNTTAEQMKMFLTRLGFGSRMVVTGDVTQVDLPGGKASGLKVVTEILAGIDDIAICRLDAGDVVRHRLVGDIVDAYSRWDESRPHPTQRRRGAQQPKGNAK